MTQLRKGPVVLLDVGGVIALPNAYELTRALNRQRRITDSSVREAHYRAVRVVDDQPPHTWATYLSAMGQSILNVAVLDGPERRRLDFGLRAEAWLSVVPGAQEALAKLHEGDASVGFVSNSSGGVSKLLEQLRIMPKPAGGSLDWPVIDSSVVGVDKPNPEPFRLALDLLGRPDPVGVWHVGDTVHADMEGARAAGVQGVHFDPYGLCKSPEKEHRHAENWIDLLKIILP